MKKNGILILFTLLIALAILPIAGCESLRLAASEDQKKLAFDTYQRASQVDLYGAEPKTETTAKLVTGTSAGLTYIGMPKEPEITDYTATASQAKADAAKRPTAEKVWDGVDGFLELGIGVAALFSGGAAVKITQNLKEAKEKSAALREVIQKNQKFLDSLPKDDTVRAMFKDIHAKNRPASTEKFITEIKTA